MRETLKQNQRMRTDNCNQIANALSMYAQQQHRNKIRGGCGGGQLEEAPFLRRPLTSCGTTTCLTDPSPPPVSTAPQEAAPTPHECETPSHLAAPAWPLTTSLASWCNSAASSTSTSSSHASCGTTCSPSSAPPPTSEREPPPPRAPAAPVRLA